VLMQFNFENVQITEDHFFTFLGDYSNYYNCYIPRVGESQHGNGVLLRAPLYHLPAIYTYAELFHCSSPEERKAFVKVGYPLLSIKTISKN